jgi:hypothetical protein
MKHIYLFLIFVLLLAGCGERKPDGLPPLVPVKIILTQEGKPLDGAIVSLEDPSGGVKFTVGGTTNSSGVAEIYTHGNYKGAPLGKYKVRVLKNVTEESPSAPPENTPEYDKFMGEYAKNPPRTYRYVEKQYSDINTTPLEIDITGKTTQTLDAGKDIKEEIR